VKNLCGNHKSLLSANNPTGQFINLLKKFIFC
jgi:hypothetical protein